MSADITIDDLKYDELRQIVGYLSVRQLFICRRVCRKWYEIIDELLDSNPVLSLHYNDINHFTNEELNRKCTNDRHLAVNVSVGRVLGETNAFVAAFKTPDLNQIQHKLFKLFDFCPKIQSLDLSQVKVKSSDIDVLFDHCPLLQCLCLSSDETNWTKFLSHRILVLKHFSLTLSSKTPIYGVYERPPEEEDYEMCNLTELLIEKPLLNEMNLIILCYFLKNLAKKLTKFHFTPFHITSSQALDLINALCIDSENTVLKDFNLNANVSQELLESLTKFKNLETLYLHFTTESQQKNCLKGLKSLRRLHLDFDANRSAFSMEGIHMESNNLFSNVLSNMPTGLSSLTLCDAELSLSVFEQIVKHLPNLRELELMFVSLEKDSERYFWEIISCFKLLSKLTLNTTDITEDGFEHIFVCECLDWLELVKYKGPNAAQTYITTQRALECFGILAAIRPDHWFDLRIDIDICEVDEDIRGRLPRNVRVVNVGHKK